MKVAILSGRELKLVTMLMVWFNNLCKEYPDLPDKRSLCSTSTHVKSVVAQVSSTSMETCLALEAMKGKLEPLFYE